MQPILDIGGAPLRSGVSSQDYLHQQIAFFEMRLREMGHEGDCAYERALSRVYHLLLHQRRDQLASLKQTNAR